MTILGMTLEGWIMFSAFVLLMAIGGWFALKDRGGE